MKKPLTARGPINPEDNSLSKSKSGGFFRLQKCDIEVGALGSLHAIESVNEDMAVESCRKKGENLNDGLFDEVRKS